jgi:hypothetical protein
MSTGAAGSGAEVSSDTGVAVAAMVESAVTVSDEVLDVHPADSPPTVRTVTRRTRDPGEDRRVKAGRGTMCMWKKID